MEISREAIQELRQIHKKLTGEGLSDGQTLEMAQKLFEFELVMVVYKPIPSEYVMEQGRVPGILRATLRKGAGRTRHGDSCWFFSSTLLVGSNQGN